MDSYQTIQCLLEKGLISPSYAAKLQKYAVIAPYDATTIFALAGEDVGSPASMESQTANASTPQSFSTDLTGVVAVVATAHDEDAFFTVIEGGDPAGTDYHVLAADTNYTFTVDEWRNFKFVASSSSCSISATYYK
jgi:hypothetical protein